MRAQVRSMWLISVLLPLYYLADATITLGRRAIQGDAIWKAHRTHFYQRATDNGLKVHSIVSRVFTLNLALVMLAMATVMRPSMLVDAVALGLGAVLVAQLLWRFAARRS